MFLVVRRRDLSPGAGGGGVGDGAAAPGPGRLHLPEGVFSRPLAHRRQGKTTNVKNTKTYELFINQGTVRR